MMHDHYDYLYKIVLIGNTNVGKTNLLLRLSQNKFINETKPTIGVEFDAKTFKFDNAIVKAQIWDTAGQERYRAITSAYYRGTMGALLVYDVKDRKSFDDCINYWLIQLNEHANDIVVGLIGNKCDLGTGISEARNVAENNNFIFYETSALNGDNVEIAFETLVRAIYDKQRKMDKGKVKKKIDKEILQGAAIKKIKGKKKGGCC